MRLTDAPAVEQHPVAHLVAVMTAGLDDASEINTWHHRKAAYHRAAAADGKAILVVERAVLNPHCDVTVRQLAVIQLGQAGLILIFFFVDK